MRVVVVGGGATGLGVAWDLTLRGLQVTLLEKDEIGSGTSGRFHGLLHSGGRYLVTDPNAAKGCISENLLLQKIAGEAVVASGGYFVKKYGDDEEFERNWLDQAARVGVPFCEVPASKVKAEIPMLTPDAERVYSVPDGVLEGFKMLSMLVASLKSRGCEIVEHTRATKLEVVEGSVTAVVAEDTSGTRRFGCDAVVNAAGPWAGLVARDWGLEIKVQPSYGLMLIFANRRLTKVVNHLKWPSDGDIFVPHGEVVILGTTDVPSDSPEAPKPERSEVLSLMHLGMQLIPDLESWRILRAFNGVRPLYEPSGLTKDSRNVSRDYAVIDHEDSGLGGVFSILGGKWTTFRLMGEAVGDRVQSFLGLDSPSRSTEVPITSATRTARVGDAGPLLCECERVYEGDLVLSNSVSALRLQTWFSMGPCQGTFCAHRVLGRSHHYGLSDELADLRKEREHGIDSVLWGANARLGALERSIRSQSLGEELT